MSPLLRGTAAIIVLSVGMIAASPAGAEFFADAEAGGGYDGNLNAASHSGDAKGDGFGFGTAAFGASADRGGIRTDVAARWSGTAYSRYSDLSSHRIAIEGGLRMSPAPSFTFRLAPSVGGSFYGDAERSALELGLLAGVRFEPKPGLSIEPSYAFRWRSARVSVFDRTAHRFSIALGANPWKRTFVRATTTAELGQVVRYFEQTTAGAGGGGGGGGGESGAGGRGRPNDTFGGDLVADREGATSWETALSLEQGLSDRIFLAAGGGFARIWSDPDDFDIFFVNASLGLRWP